MTDIKLGALCWNQYTDWASLEAAGVRAERLGYDSLWTWDHVYPIVGSSDGPMFEGWLTLAAWAKVTSRVRIGLMVGANPYREPSLVAKMATTLDHISGGRAVLGIGSAWFDEEAAAFGFAFGESPAERLRWLAEALPVIRGMLHGEAPSAAGPRYATREVKNLPAPVQATLPILVGGGGEKVTLKLVAQYADACNLYGPIEDVARKEAILVQHCETVGRDPATIERTTGRGPTIIRSTREEAQRAATEILARNGGAQLQPTHAVGTAQDIIDLWAPFVRLGYRHLVVGLPSPYDDETMERLITDVKPALEAVG